MTKILNLDQIQTKAEKAIVLNGKEHVMKTFTVKEYLYHMKEAEKLTKLEDNEIDTLSAGLDATISILLNAFPTVTRAEFEALNMPQLDAIRGLIDDAADEDLGGDDKAGEATGTVE